jgi:hypothetical protein
MKSAVTPLIGRWAALSCRSTPGPASTRKTRSPTTIAVAGPEAAGSSRGIPVPSRTTIVLSPAPCFDPWAPMDAQTIAGKPMASRMHRNAEG